MPRTGYTDHKETVPSMLRPSQAPDGQRDHDRTTVRVAMMDPRYLNNAIASSASTPPVIEIGANVALAATSALDSMI